MLYLLNIFLAQCRTAVKILSRKVLGKSADERRTVDSIRYQVHPKLMTKT